MRKYVLILAVVVAAFWAQGASAQYYFDWECSYDDCTFAANQPAGVSSYEWKFGDGNFGSGPNEAHTYNSPGCGTQSFRVTLTYYLTNSTIINKRCYVSWYEPCAGGDPNTYISQGTCSTFN